MNAAAHASLRLAAWLLALALVALPVVAVVNGWIGADRWPLRTLRVQGELQRVDAQRLRATVLPYARDGFFAVRLADAQAAVAKLPWVAHAEVSKRWPDVIEVRIVEHKPFAQWGKDRLLSENGTLFPIAGARVPTDLPRFDIEASGARIADVVAIYNQASELFAPDGKSVRVVSLDRRGSWSLLLSSGTEVVIGSQEERARVARFARLLPQLLLQKPLPLARADLRYTNGFALTWTSGREQVDAIKASAAASGRPAMNGRAGRPEAHVDAPWMDAMADTPSPPPTAAGGGSNTQQGQT